MKRRRGLALTAAAGASGALLISAPPALGAQATSVSAGDSGKVRCWGSNSAGQTNVPPALR